MPAYASRPPVQALWIGSRLSALERLAVASFVRNGHEFHLYAYEDPEGVPKGAVVLDGNEVLPGSRIFTYQGNGSVAGFANFFRYKLLLERGGWWVDCDTICLKPFDFDTDHVFSSEVIEGVEVVDNAAMLLPPGSALAAYAWDVCRSKDPASLVWGETGPRLVAEAVEKLGLWHCVKPAATFCPISYLEWNAVISPGTLPEFGPETYGVHLWNEMWRRNGQDKDACYPPDCLYETLKAKYLTG